MRKFFKDNLLSVIFCTFAMAGLSYASTYNRPYTSADYAGGAKAVGSKVNTEFQDLANWLNGGNIESGNIAVLGVRASNLFSNFAISDSSSLFTSTGVTATQVTNFSKDITTGGRPVHLSIQNTSTVYAINGTDTLFAGLYSDDNINHQSYVGFYRNGSLIAQSRVNFGGIVNRADACSAFSYIDFIVAGSYTYTVKVFNAAGFTTTVVGCRFVVREL